MISILFVILECITLSYSITSKCVLVFTKDLKNLLYYLYQYLPKQENSICSFFALGNFCFFASPSHFTVFFLFALLSYLLIFSLLFLHHILLLLLLLYFLFHHFPTIWHPPFLLWFPLKRKLFESWSFLPTPALITIHIPSDKAFLSFLLFSDCPDKKQQHSCHSQI